MAASAAPAPTASSLPYKRHSIYEDYAVVWDVSLGTGINGSVVLCVDRKTKKNYALKCLRPRPESYREIDLQWECRDHPGIVQCFAAYENVIQRGANDPRSPTNTLLLVLELMQEELFSRIERQKRFSEDEAAEIIRDMASIVKHLHSKNIAHRDLKPENFLYDSTEGGTLKISDFGFAKRDLGDLMTPVYTPFYVPQEILVAHEVYTLKKAGTWPASSVYAYDKSCDMWSMGVILYIILCGYPPFQSEVQGQTISLQMRNNIMTSTFHFHPKYWDHISNAAKSVVQGLLESQPAERMTAEQLVQHPWLAVEQPSPPFEAKSKSPRLPSPSQLKYSQRDKLDMSDALTSMRIDTGVQLKQRNITARPDILKPKAGSASKRKFAPRLQIALANKNKTALNAAKKKAAASVLASSIAVNGGAASTGPPLPQQFPLASAHKLEMLAQYAAHPSPPDNDGPTVSALATSVLQTMDNDRARVAAVLTSAGHDATGLYVGKTEPAAIADAFRKLAQGFDAMRRLSQHIVPGNPDPTTHHKVQPVPHQKSSFGGARPPIAAEADGRPTALVSDTGDETPTAAEAGDETPTAAEADGIPTALVSDMGDEKASAATEADGRPTVFTSDVCAYDRDCKLPLPKQSPVPTVAPTILATTGSTVPGPSFPAGAAGGTGSDSKADTTATNGAGDHRQPSAQVPNSPPITQIVTADTGAGTGTTATRIALTSPIATAITGTDTSFTQTDSTATSITTATPITGTDTSFTQTDTTATVTTEKAFQNKSLVLQQTIKFKDGNWFNVPHTSATDRAALPGCQKVCRSEGDLIGQLLNTVECDLLRDTGKTAGQQLCDEKKNSRASSSHSSTAAAAVAIAAAKNIDADPQPVSSAASSADSFGDTPRTAST